MEPQFWHERWQTDDIGFHQPEGHDLLPKHWPTLALSRGASVLVPLCGKSLDMVWLADQGHHVIGVELSEIAVDQFYDERGVVPRTETSDGFLIKSAGPYELWCGDMLSLSSSATQNVSAIYDRASLVALPPAIQPRFAEKLATLVKPGTKGLLIALDYDLTELAGPPFATPPGTVSAIFERDFTLRTLATRDGLAQSQNLKKRGATRLDETVYLLERR